LQTRGPVGAPKEWRRQQTLVVVRGEKYCRPFYLLYFVDPPDRFLLFYLDLDYQLYFNQRNISGSVGRLPYIRMPTR
jgi:hypothetical protein